MKKGLLGIGIAAAVLSVALLGCQSIKTPTLPASIQTEQTGLAPNGDRQFSTIDFSLLYGGEGAIVSWKVEMVAGSGTVKQWHGDGNTLPSTLTWDGRSEAGTLASEGIYTAWFTVTYRTAETVTAQSQKFIVDVSPPTGSLKMTPSQFTPAPSGVVQPIAIAITASSAVARMDSWSLDILDEDGQVFTSFDGRWPSASVTWDGKSSGGAWVAPAQNYTARAILRDEFGNTSRITSAILVADLPAKARPMKVNAPGGIAITPGARGFSPSSDSSVTAMSLALSYGVYESMKSWKVEILDSDQHTQKTFSGDGANVPKEVVWDGKRDEGVMAHEGQYTALFSVVYSGDFKPGHVVSAAFVLDITPPAGSITLSDPLYSPIEGSPVITLNVDAHSRLAKIDSWKIEIYDPESHFFKSFSSKWPTASAVWDGKGFQGDLVQSAEDYPVVLKIRDEFGNVGQMNSTIPVDILIEKTATGFRIQSSRIFFKPYTADYKDVRPDLAKQNMRRLSDMAAKLKKFPDYKIRLVGHAVMVNWDNAALGKAEERDVLVPLSLARADAVKKAVVARGLNPAMFTTEGVGASDQLVPDSDLGNHWRNRRVAFFIER
jgi:outer membrane protein OmpA-like peptidoglycan-associated protein/flagellar hook assembly protein FlgD